VCGRRLNRTSGCSVCRAVFSCTPLKGRRVWARCETAFCGGFPRRPCPLRGGGTRVRPRRAYNSNSFVAGLLNSLSLPLPAFPESRRDLWRANDVGRATAVANGRTLQPTLGEAPCEASNQTSTDEADHVHAERVSVDRTASRLAGKERGDSGAR
jgi:hypothetical protein